MIIVLDTNEFLLNNNAFIENTEITYELDQIKKTK